MKKNNGSKSSTIKFEWFGSALSNINFFLKYAGRGAPSPANKTFAIRFKSLSVPPIRWVSKHPRFGLKWLSVPRGRPVRH